MNNDQLILKILDFMTVIHECYSKTTFANDRSVYAKDLATAMGWIIELRAGTNIQIVKNRILSSDTEKHFGDYWRQGEWGDNESRALKKLKNTI